MNILIVEDCKLTIEVIKISAEFEDNKVTICENFKDVKHINKFKEFDLVILDLKLSDGNGMELLKKIKKNKEKYSKPLVIVETSENDESIINNIYDFGAVDYIKKPFTLLEIKKKIMILKEIMKLTGIICENKIIYEKLEIDKYEMLIYENDKILDFTNLEYNLIMYFIKNKKKIVSRECLIENIWGNKLEVSDRAVDQCIKKIRKKSITLQKNIESIRGIGYRLK